MAMPWDSRPVRSTDLRLRASATRPKARIRAIAPVCCATRAPQSLAGTATPARVGQLTFLIGCVAPAETAIL